MEDSEAEFNDLLNNLKEYLNKPIEPYPMPTTGGLRNYFIPGYRENNPERDSLYRTQIKILESGIFYIGGIKGKVLERTQLGRIRGWQVWPISNLDELLDKLADVMTVAMEGETKEYVSSRFDNLLNAYNSLAPLVRLGGVRKETLKKRRKELEGWKKQTINKLPTSIKKIAPEIAETLIAHLPPRTPDLTIAERIKELMAAFNQEGGKIETLRKMVADKRKK
jgi:hypothetical protein